MKPTVRIFTTQTQILQHKGLRDQSGKLRFSSGLNGGGLCGIKATRQAEMEFKFLHHIRIAINRQKCALAIRQLIGSAPGNLRLGQGRTKAVQPLDHLCGQIGQCRIFARHERKESPQQDQFQPLHRNPALILRQCRDGLRQILGRHARSEAERRFDGAVEPVFARLGRVSRNARHIGVAHSTTPRKIPSQPRSGGVSKSAITGRIIDRKAFHLVHTCRYPAFVTPR